jgi:hypothetical protein
MKAVLIAIPIKPRQVLVMVSIQVLIQDQSLCPKKECIQGLALQPLPMNLIPLLALVKEILLIVVIT